VTLPHTITTLEIVEHLRRYPTDGLAFTAERGVIRRPVFGRLVWRHARARAGLDGFRFGELRHTGATLALHAGANPVLVAFRLGHTSTGMPEQHYAGRLDRAGSLGIRRKPEGSDSLRSTSFVTDAMQSDWTGAFSLGFR
jgi:integrase